MCEYDYQYFFFKYTATTESYKYGHTLSRHDALPSVAEFRRRGRVRNRPRDAAPRVRSRRHAYLSRQQLRPAIRLGGGEFRPRPRDRSRPAPRRTGELDTGGGGHVARPVRRCREQPQIADRALRPEAQEEGAR